MIREAIVEGQFYSAGARELEKQIRECFTSRFGPGKFPEKGNHRNPTTLGYTSLHPELARLRSGRISRMPKIENSINEEKHTLDSTSLHPEFSIFVHKSISGLISPHAGYMFSGPCAAWGYKEMAESRQPETFILLGLSHNGYDTCLSLDDWKTPLGVVKNDIKFQEALLELSPIVEDSRVHASEHSIEVQLPFLQFMHKNIQIAPIIASPDIHYSEIASYIYKAIQKTKRNVITIASSDFTHYGWNYGFFPFRDKVKQNMYKLDGNAIQHIESLKADEFLEYTERTGATICGKYPIAVLLELTKKLGAKKGTLLKYYTSGDIIDDYSSAVGYASIKIN